MDAFLRGYLTAALWSSSDENGQSFDRNFGIKDIDHCSMLRATADCKAFCEANAADLEATGYSTAEFTAYERHGHDFWLTRNHHGAGFWDRGYGEAGERLTKAAHKWGEVNVSGTIGGNVSIDH